MQSMEEPFNKSPLHFFYSSQIFLTPPSTISSSSCYTPFVIIIDNTPVGSPPHLSPSPEIPSIAAENPNVSSPHSHNGPRQEFTNLPPTLMIPRAILHKSINTILLEHC
ncbi:hypothetical protein O181_122756 [Austropuccinia psidii MF-1]|uniref:Uncharacterized protein n=1 Tax=Austropuccinia psidii MF-1 TaxID=1389203 RepID=A0A9Q3Q2N2_9BASI|nr:hypothetical protein [Austropuccinia psidii MF-1]